MLIHWIWLAHRPSLNDRQRLRVLETYGGDAEAVFFAKESDFAALEELSPEEILALGDKNLTEAQEILRKCEDKHIRLCSFDQPEYPERLRQIPDPPVLLYYKGTLPDTAAAPVIAAVGTRKASAYGQTVAQRLGFQIAQCGGILVSGLAQGIDGRAMQGALMGGGQVIGVLGCGADLVYPRQNRGLFEEVAKSGCLLTEYPPETPPLGWHFPRRNRIISGLSNGVVVIEAPERSGSLITARQAAEQGRDVFVVPGNVDVDSFVGSNALLRDGAIPVRNGWDVLAEYQALYPHMRRRPEQEEAAMELPQVAQKPLEPKAKSASKKKKSEKALGSGEKSAYNQENKPLPQLSDEEQSIVELLTQPVLVDEIIEQVQLPAARVLALLTVLQIKGVVRQLPGKRVALK